MFLKKLRPMAAVCLVAAAACGQAERPAAPPAAGAQKVDASKAASVAGRVLVEGAIPENPIIRPASDPVCMRETPAGTRFENFVVSDGGLENVFVYVKDSLGQYQFDIPSEPVKLDQVGCLYTPHVIGVRAGQPIEVSNSDQTLHNVHARAENNQPFNIGQPAAGQKNLKTFTVREVMVRFTCDVHGWMTAYAGVMDHPFFAVTTDGGRFELKGLPAGTYTVEAWHEKLGTQSQSVTVADHESKSVTFTFTSQAAAN